MYKFISFLFALIVVAFLVSVTLINALPHFGYTFLPISYEDSEIGISSGDSLVIQPTKLSDLKADDVIAYYNTNDVVCVHKILSVDTSSNFITVELQETAIKTFSEKVPATNLIGKKAVDLKGCTSVINFFSAFYGQMLSFLIGAIFLLCLIATKKSKKYV